MTLRLCIGLICGTGACCASLLPHSSFLDKYRALKSKYLPNGKQQPVTEEIERMCEEVLNDLHVKQDLRKRLQLFNVYDYNLMHAGTAHMQYGAIIGIPMNFEYKNPNAMSRDILYFRDKPVDWASQIAQNFLNSLVLSENAQKFGIAREILYLQENYPLTRTALLALQLSSAYLLYDIIEDALKFKQKTKLFRNTFALAYTLANICLFIVVMDRIKCASDLEVDKRLSALGPKYIKGGKEFYEKLLQKNAALRKLLGEDGEVFFTVSGNENSVVRRKHVPISQRKKYFESKFQNIHQLV